MVNNAGITLEDKVQVPVWELPEDVWDQTHRINSRGVFLGTKYACAQMVKQDPHPCGDRGWIVNLASIYGLNGSAQVSKFAG